MIWRHIEFLLDLNTSGAFETILKVCINDRAYAIPTQIIPIALGATVSMDSGGKQGLTSAQPRCESQPRDRRHCL